MTGDYDSHDDVTFTVESHDVELTLITVTIDGRTYPVEMSNKNARLLSRAIDNETRRNAWWRQPLTGGNHE